MQQRARGRVGLGRGMRGLRAKRRRASAAGSLQADALAGHLEHRVALQRVRHQVAAQRGLGVQCARTAGPSSTAGRRVSSNQPYPGTTRTGPGGVV